ncbi:hypothetical protein F6455_17835 [Proteobacteria bacterium 005FR1]|nr:hypothetical protein [Proteobacteria bacterium 005FR1]
MSKVFRGSVHAALARLFLAYDAAYRVIFRLQPVNEFLFINRAVYKGPERRFADGTVLSPGDPIGVIHFNNQFMSQVQARSGKSNTGKRAAFAFGAALIKSMHKLGQQLGQSPALGDLKVISGITWFKAHGRQLGFEIEPLPPGRRKRMLRAHFRVLLRLLFPHLAQRENHRLEPHQFWMTRNQLRQLVVSEDQHVVKRLVKYDNQRL